MNADADSEVSNSSVDTAERSPLSGPVTAGVLSVIGISIGFFGLKMLMQERPEFVGQPVRVTRAELIQDSPRVVARKVSDDIAVIKPTQPEFSDIRFNMTGRRDYRGLRTIRDMSGEFRARYLLTNAADEASFVLFKCPHPRTENEDGQTLLASELRLQASINGLHENSTNAWFWSGSLEPRSAATIDISYRVGSLKGVTYRVAGQDGSQVKQARVSIHREDLSAMRFESGDGTKRPPDDTVVWERRDFLAPDFFSAQIEEARNLYASLSRLLEIGPLITLLFLVSISSVILVRQRVTAIQMFTIAAGYALYFPLILYLSANLSFVWALLIAVIVPGALLLNYARWLLGAKVGLIGGGIFLALYQVFPTLAALAGWNRGMVLLCLGIVTLAVLINLQNRALKQKAPAAALAALLMFALPANSAEVQVILPADIAKLPETRRESTNTQVAFDPAQYQVTHDVTHFRVELRAPFEVVRAGESPFALFAAPVYLQEKTIDSAEAGTARLVTMTNRLGLFAQHTGPGTLHLVYRVPMENREGKNRVAIPLLAGLPGNVRVQSPRNNIEVLTGSLWGKTSANKITSYEIGVASEETLLLEWRGEGGNVALAPGTEVEGGKEFYGIGLRRAQNLTIVNSDGSCTHFAEFDVPVSQSEEFRLKLPAKARLISASVNGAETSSPAVENQLCRIRLPARTGQQTAHRLSFRIAYPSVRLGFMGITELMLPEAFQTVGRLEWVVALPNGFDTQIISSGLETQKSAPDLEAFGDYGRILKSHPHTYFAKDLAPPAVISLTLKYRQMVAGM